MTDIRSATNPIFGDNKLKLGVFGANGPGTAFTTVPELFQPTWENSIQVTQWADQMGIEANIPYQRFKAFNRHDLSQSMESSAWASAVCARTTDSCVMATTHVPTLAPVVSAKSASTMDQISGGRFGINIVCGWFKAEIGMFGGKLAEHESRYEMADEWITIHKRLWTEDEPFDFDGKFYKLKNLMIEPKPVQPGGPALMNAGASGRGAHFAAKHVDIAFTSLTDMTPEGIAASTANYRKLAREEYGRDIQVWTHTYVVLRDTIAEAKRYVTRFSDEYGDRKMADLYLGSNIPGYHELPEEEKEKQRLANMTGRGYGLLGNADDIASSMSVLSDCGLDGILLTWIDYTEGLPTFGREVMPLLVNKGLRAK
jgi:alkanesulfonate monooxygenase SsuD/methylene tetrahydromethanopterin reductase-like flavin-dependent oxidoreductase (luciferase family)